MYIYFQENIFVIVTILIVYQKSRDLEDKNTFHFT